MQNLRALSHSGGIDRMIGPAGIHQRRKLPEARAFFIGRIHNLGPNSEANYTDQRYWLVEQKITNTDGDGTTDLTWADDGNDNALWVTATNMAEVISQSHAFPDDDNYPVMVYRSSDATGVARYVFTSLPIVID